MLKKIISSILLLLFINLNFPDIVFAKSYQISSKQYCYDKNSSDKKLYLYKVIKNKKYGVVSLDGDLILPVKYSELSVDTACYFKTKKEKDSKSELYSWNGELVIPAVYDYIIPNFGKYLVVRDNEKFGLIDYQNNIILPIEFHSYYHHPATDSEYILKNNQKLMLITDEKITQLPYESAYFNRNGTLWVFLNKKKGVYSIEKEKCIIPAKYNDVLYLNENLLIAQLNNKYSVYDKDGNVIFNNNIYEYEKISDLVVIKKDNNKYDLYYLKDKIRNKSAKNENPQINSGKELLKPLLTDKEFIDFEYYYFDNNYNIKVKDKGKFGIVRFNSETEQFTTFIPFIYDSISNPSRDFDYIARQGSKYFNINPKTGEIESEFSVSKNDTYNSETNIDLLEEEEKINKKYLISIAKEQDEEQDEETEQNVFKKQKTKLFTDDEEINKAYSNAIKENQKPKRHKRYKMPLYEEILGGVVVGVVFGLWYLYDFLDNLSFKISKPLNRVKVNDKKEKNKK